MEEVTGRFTQGPGAPVLRDARGVLGRIAGGSGYGAGFGSAQVGVGRRPGRAWAPAGGSAMPRPARSSATTLAASVVVAVVVLALAGAAVWRLASATPVLPALALVAALSATGRALERARQPAVVRPWCRRSTTDVCTAPPV